MAAKQLLEINACGLYCPEGDFYIDPWKPVSYAVITHAHSDHARSGSDYYLCHEMTEGMLKHRLGDVRTQALPYGRRVTRNGINISLHPAGHIPGSAQIKIERGGEIWVVSGDYKLSNDGISVPWEPVKCHVFITESTFGLPVYKWTDQSTVFSSVREWWSMNAGLGRASVIGAYSLGKAQRILHNLADGPGEVFCHGAVASSNEVLERAGLKLPAWNRIEGNEKKDRYAGSLVICPPSALGSSWMKRFGNYSSGYCSGWMAVRGARRRRAVDRGFVLSDHADWPELLKAVRETEAEKIWITHGYSAQFARYLNEHGLEAAELHTLYGEEDEQ